MERGSRSPRAAVCLALLCGPQHGKTLNPRENPPNNRRLVEPVESKELTLGRRRRRVFKGKLPSNLRAFLTLKISLQNSFDSSFGSECQPLQSLSQACRPRPFLSPLQCLTGLITTGPCPVCPVWSLQWRAWRLRELAPSRDPASPITGQ